LMTKWTTISAACSGLRPNGQWRTRIVFTSNHGDRWATTGSSMRLRRPVYRRSSCRSVPHEVCTRRGCGTSPHHRRHADAAASRSTCRRIGGCCSFLVERRYRRCGTQRTGVDQRRQSSRRARAGVPVMRATSRARPSSSRIAPRRCPRAFDYRRGSGQSRMCRATQTISR
jgi:hypothetical protein